VKRSGLALLALLALPAPGLAQDRAVLPAGASIRTDLGGGGTLGSGSSYTPSGVFEGEIAGGYDVWNGVTPQLALVLGMAPGSYAGLRLGVEVPLPAILAVPVYARAALDLSSSRGFMRARWLLAGAGVEMRLTDLVGAFAEVDLAVPLTTGAGLPLLARAGTTFRF
jgi:hypothetical protein